MKPLKDIVRLIRNARIKTANTANARVLDKMRAAYDDSSHGHTITDTGGHVVRLAIAAAILVAAGVLISHLAQLAGGNVAWAEVTKRFEAVPFFSVSIYMKDDATDEPTQMDLWMSQDGHIRLRIAKHVVFAYDGQIKAYDVASRQAVEPDEMAKVFIDKIGQAGEFSLEAIIDVMFGGRPTDVTPLVNPDAVISEDMIVFDVALPDTPEWVRIWALRESRLPVRIQMWDPRDGASTDAVFTYSKEQPTAFFDPNAFSGVLQTHNASNTGVVYAFQVDPGGKNITPEAMFQQSGYHMPVVKQAGMTEDGAFWVLAEQALNRMPNGNPFYGFPRVQDDLGRTYVSAAGSHRSRDDASLNIFVPLDFPFDGNRPSRITLFCEAHVQWPNPTPELVGTVELTQWDRNAPCPDLSSGGDRSSLELKLSLADQLDAPKHAGRLARLLATIPSWSEQPENERLLTFWIRRADRQADFEEAVRIGQVLTPLLLARPRGQSRYSFTEHLVALAATNRLDEAKTLFARIDGLSEPTPKKEERYYGIYVEDLIESLAENSGLSADQIGEVLGFDIGTNDAYRQAAERGKRDAGSAESDRQVQERRAELAAYYQGHPLPEKAELIDRTRDCEIYLGGEKNTLPGHPGYRILPINCGISGVVSNLRTVGADQSDARKVHPYQAAIRFAGGLEDRRFNADLVYREGIKLPECFRLVLAARGLELTTEAQAVQEVFVARYDGRQLKNCPAVRVPWNVDAEDKGLRAWSVADLLEVLSQRMPPGCYILDQTNLDKFVCVGNGDPTWQGAEGVEQAKRWLQEQFGITMAKEGRTITTYRIQRRAQ